MDGDNKINLTAQAILGSEKMKQEEKKKIETICKDFASGFEPDIPLNGSGWLIVDPLSGYLSEIEGIKNEPVEYPATDERPQVLILKFPDGTKLIPAGADLGIKGATNWMWIDPEINPAPAADKTESK